MGGCGTQTKDGGGEAPQSSASRKLYLFTKTYQLTGIRYSAQSGYIPCLPPMTAIIGSTRASQPHTASFSTSLYALPCHESLTSKSSLGSKRGSARDNFSRSTTFSAAILFEIVGKRVMEGRQCPKPMIFGQEIGFVIAQQCEVLVLR